MHLFIFQILPGLSLGPRARKTSSSGIAAILTHIDYGILKLAIVISRDHFLESQSNNSRITPDSVGGSSPPSTSATPPSLRLLLQLLKAHTLSRLPLFNPYHQQTQDVSLHLSDVDIHQHAANSSAPVIRDRKTQWRHSTCNFALLGNVLKIDKLLVLNKYSNTRLN